MLRIRDPLLAWVLCLALAEGAVLLVLYLSPHHPLWMRTLTGLGVGFSPFACVTFTRESRSS
jgi:hypothetical protein